MSVYSGLREDQQVQETTLDPVLPSIPLTEMRTTRSLVLNVEYFPNRTVRGKDEPRSGWHACACQHGTMTDTFQHGTMTHASIS